MEDIRDSEQINENARKKDSKMAQDNKEIGIVALGFSLAGFIPLVGVIFLIIGLIFNIKYTSSKSSSRALCIASWAVSIIASIAQVIMIAVTVIMTTVYIALSNKVSDITGNYDDTSGAYVYEYNYDYDVDGEFGGFGGDDGFMVD